MWLWCSENFLVQDFEKERLSRNTNFSSTGSRPKSVSIDFTLDVRPGSLQIHLAAFLCFFFPKSISARVGFGPISPMLISGGFLQLFCRPASSGLWGFPLGSF